MAIGSPFRVAAALMLCGPLLVGCSRESTRAASAVASAAAHDDALVPPRPIELPDRMRPIAPDSGATSGLSARISMAATYERGGDRTGQRLARIVDVSSAAPSASSAAIREPLGGGLDLTTAAPAPRATTEPPQPWVPIESPSALPARAEPPLPVLAARPVLDPPPAIYGGAHPPEPRADDLAAYGDGAASPAAAEDRWTAHRRVPPQGVYATSVEQPSWDALAPQAPAPIPLAAWSVPDQRPDPAQFQPVIEHARQISNRGFAMAERGMLYAARAELIQSLQLVAQALDVQQGSSHHAQALAGGLAALEEARDFQSPAGGPAAVVDVLHMAAGHHTPVLHQLPAAVSPVVAQQQYFAYAQAQFAVAAGGVPVASQGLYRLGKLETALAAQDDNRLATHGPQAMVFHQAALAADAANYLAANELGVLMARYGQLAEARRLLLHSVSLRPHAEGWHNLSVVHRRLGETELAKRAEREKSLLAKSEGKGSRISKLPVEWVDRHTFAASTPRDVIWPESKIASPATSSSERR